MRFTVLGSGSTGNAVLITAGNTRILVDAGLSAKEILRRIAEVGEDCSRLDAVLVTHEFHLSRAIYLCQNAGIDSVGITADRRKYDDGSDQGGRMRLPALQQVVADHAEQEPKPDQRNQPFRSWS